MTDAPLIRCPSCGATNRVPLEKVASGLEPRCGRCRTPLPPPPFEHEAAAPGGRAAAPVEVTDESFEAEVERSSLPVLVDAWAAWCGPCHRIAPVIAELAAELSGRVRVAKLNVDENPRTASRFDLRSIPTLLIFRGGREIDRLVGVQPKAEILRRLERAAG